MTDIAELGIRVDSSPATKAAKELDALTAAATKADGATQDLAATSGRKLAPGMSAGGNQSRMMAQQLSQVAQQASATGNWVQALAIQLPDMALGFGAVGIAAGILASVTLPLLASAFGSTGAEAKAVADAVSAFDEAAQAYIAAAEAAGMSTDDLAAKYGKLSVEARSALQAMADVALVEAINAANDAVQAVADSLLDVQTFSNGRQVSVLADDFGLAKDQANGLRDALVSLQNADSLGAQAKAAAEVQRQLLAAYGSAEKMPPPLRAAFAEMARITVKAAEANQNVSRLPPILQGAAAAASNLASQVGSIGDAAAGATGAVQGLVNALVAAGNAQMALMKQSSLNYGKVQNTGGVDAIARAGNNAMGVDLTGTIAGGAGGIYRGGGGGGGGGGGSDPYADNLKALVENLRSEREIEDEWYQENLAILNDRRAQEILGKTQHDAAMVALHEEYTRRIAEIDANAGQQRLTDTANLFGALAAVASAGGQKTAKIVATFQAIEGTINAYGAAIKALNTPGITLAGRFAAYASVLAAGLKGVAAIRAAGGIGGGAGGGGLAAGGTPAQAAAPAVEYRVYGIDRDAQYSGAFWEKIWNGLFEEGKRRGVSSPQMVFMGGMP